MTTQQVAELLGVSADTVYRLKEKPDGLRAYRVGHSLRFRRDEVETYLAWTARPTTRRPRSGGMSSRRRSGRM